MEKNDKLETAAILPRYLFDRRLDGAQGRPEICVEEKHFTPLSGNFVSHLMARGQTEVILITEC
jgi:hypothetical protein